MKQIILLLLILFFGCQSYQPSVQILPPHIKTIAVKTFDNKTSIFGLEDMLRLELNNQLLKDGRFSITNDVNTADGYVSGEILYYILQPISYGENFEPKQYKLRFIVNIHFVDRVNNVTLWEEKNFEEILFFAAPTLPGGLTEEEAKKDVVYNMARKIYLRTVEGFGSVTGRSYKKIP
ncbi:MAG: LPS assembly lipoprotein LptE [Endomicrobia bacterium]|nr:LPS assembly lipoprotein LptE [Endomicrobiia bacterium]MCX7941217.1 LPS assembly lipoprotein LptE [Endomicrobiia bacterium]MDW8056089.1 LptE family protein [Elusimicrobiota bacterium]